jgi:hypothetical protein
MSKSLSSGPLRAVQWAVGVASKLRRGALEIPLGRAPLTSGVSIWDAETTAGDIGSTRKMNMPSPYYLGDHTADRDGWAASQTAGGAGNLTLTGAQPTVPLEVSLYSTGNLSGVTFTITGVNLFGNADSEVMTGPNNTTKTSTKPFTSISQVAVSGAVATAVEVGWIDSEESKSVVHPSIIHAPEGWNGYRYWLAFTPYRNANSVFENPCVVASNDFETWDAPAVNPIVASAPGSAYLSDEHLYLLPDKSKLLMMYRDSGVVAGTDRLLVIETTDGVLWTSPVVIWSKPNSGGNIRYMSPSFFHDGVNWVIYAHDNNDAGYALKRMSRAGSYSSIYTDWSAESVTTCTMTNPRGETWWHSHLIRFSDGRVIGVASDNDSAAGQMFLLQSDDGTTFSVKETPLTNNAYYRNSLYVETDPTGQANEIVIVAGRVESLSPHYRFVRVGFPLIGKFTARQNAILAASSNYSLPANDRASLVLAADVFTGTASTNIGTTSDGKTWVHGDTNNVQYDGSGHATNENTANCRAWVDVGVADFSVQIKVVTKTSTGQIWLLVRVVDGSNYWRYGCNNSSGFVDIQSIVGGSIVFNTRLDQLTYADGDIFRVECDGARLQFFLNGRMVYAMNDATFLTSKKCGIQLYHPTTAAAVLVDDFFVHRLS